jgi:hypothetical protein
MPLRKILQNSKQTWAELEVWATHAKLTGDELRNQIAYLEQYHGARGTVEGGWWI